MPVSNVSLTAPTEYAIEAQGIERRRRLAELLQQQALQQDGKTEMVSGWAIPQSPMQGVSKMAQALMGGHMMTQADDRQKALAAQLRGERASTMERATKAMNGTPEQWLGEAGIADDTRYEPAQAGDPKAAAGILAGSNDPMLQQIGMSQLFKPQEVVAGKPGDHLYDKATGAIRSTLPQAPKQPNWQRVELPTPTGGKRVGVMDMNAQNPLTTFQEGGTENPAMQIGPAGQAYNPRALEAGNILADPNKPFSLVQGPNGPVSQPNVPFQTYETGKARAGAATTSIKIDNKVGEGIAKEVGPMIAESRSGAQGALDTLDAAGRITRAIAEGKVIAGPGADLRVLGDQIALATGLGGADTAERLQNTRQVVKGLASFTLGARKALKGQGAVSDYEGQLLEKASSGNIDSLTLPEIKSIVSVADRLARAQHQSHRRQLTQMRSDPNLRGLADFFDVPDLPGESNAGPQLSPTAKQYIDRVRQRQNGGG